VQLAEGPADVGGLAVATLEELREGLPEAARDLKLNLASVLAPQGALSETQRWGVAVATAIATRNRQLRDAVIGEAALHVSRDVLEDAQSAAAVMGMNNVYYRFRHIIEKQVYSEKPARLRMNRLAKPLASKLDFELFALAVSAVNNCAACVKSHEQVVIDGGLTDEQVHDAVRIAAVMNGVAIALELGELPTVTSAAVD
jgi:lipoyl-dependent peroxiredoxin subunit D